ncbi:MAG: tRNA epoxyqueuosine(34) reductase QueG [Rhodanobacteraceae bacterium]|nr:tRNA epoxyqueuosine(34) reductase QueG [Rhodanobacteraceae bacterium]
MRAWALCRGFQATGVSQLNLSADAQRLNDWLALGRHGEMDYMARHGSKRWTPAELVPGTLSVISARMDYWPADSADTLSVLEQPELGYVSRYALGRDYHKLLRSRLQKLADDIAQRVGPFGYRVFVDSAPVLEKPLARNAGLGWIGKHTNLIARDAGSYFFLGEIYTDLLLPPDSAVDDHCGSCTRCLDACPTGALPAPYQIDARRCISYLTIELHGPIPLELRPMLGNRIYGCDDCQLVCPWNKYAKLAGEPDFRARHGLDASSLVELFGWEEATFLARTEGSAIRRVGYLRWLRNIAVALGNGPRSDAALVVLQDRQSHADETVREAVRWALERLQTPRTAEHFPSALDRATRIRAPG